VSAQHHDDLVHGALSNTLEHGLEQDALLRSAEALRGAGGEN
jgi:hypothetical protein